MVNLDNETKMAKRMMQGLIANIDAGNIIALSVNGSAIREDKAAVSFIFEGKPDSELIPPKE